MWFLLVLIATLPGWIVELTWRGLVAGANVWLVHQLLWVIADDSPRLRRCEATVLALVVAGHALAYHVVDGLLPLRMVGYSIAIACGMFAGHVVVMIGREFARRRGLIDEDAADELATARLVR